jgi:serine/threonine-protein kinase
MQRLQIDPQRWTELNELLDRALDLSPGQRDVWLDSLDPRHEPLKPHLRALLERIAWVETQDFLDKLPPLGAGAMRNEPPALIGLQIGPFRLERELGVGGMGAVWLAHRVDGLINRPIALKLPQGAWRRAELIERMAREREILAQLEHPHIARLYDAGVTPEGQPWLALELVTGARIDEYCERNHLDLRGRLRLFLQVADAVAYAHSKLVVHRDLKPANVLVTEDGQARLLDFGVAKILEHGQGRASPLTELSGRALTPDYASPEQIRGEPITTSSDVYSLGVLLYELLTNQLPYRLKRDSRGALEDAILQAPPIKPSDAVGERAIARSLRGDLDTIVLKALKKTPEERYATAHALIEDLQRWLAGKPVLARPDTVRYRVSRFVARHGFAVAASLAVLLAILTATATAIRQAQVARAEQRRADDVKNFIATMLAEANLDNERSRSMTVQDWLRQARNRIDAARIENPEVRVELLTLIGAGLLSDYDAEGSLAVLRDAADEAERALGPKHIFTLRARMMRSHALLDVGRTTEVRQPLLETIAALELDSAATVPDRTRAQRLLTQLEIDEAHYDAAVAAAQRGKQIADTDAALPADERIRVLVSLANAHSFAKKTEEALSAASQAYALAERTYPDNELNPAMASAQSAYARALNAAGRFEESLVQYERVCTNREKLHGSDSGVVGVCWQNMVQPALRTGRIQAALSYAERAARISAAIDAPGSMSAEATVNASAKALLSARRGADAEPLFVRLENAAIKFFGAQHEVVARVRLDHALALAYAGRLDEARRGLVEGSSSGTPRLQQHALWIEGLIWRLDGNPSRALAVLKQARAITLKLNSEGAPAELADANVIRDIGIAQLELGVAPEARTALTEAIGRYDELYPRITPDKADALIGMARLRLDASEPQQALPLLAQADEAYRDLDAPARWSGEAKLWIERANRALGREIDALKADGN